MNIEHELRCESGHVINPYPGPVCAKNIISRNQSIPKSRESAAAYRRRNRRRGIIDSNQSRYFQRII